MIVQLTKIPFHHKPLVNLKVSFLQRVAAPRFMFSIALAVGTFGCVHGQEFVASSAASEAMNALPDSPGAMLGLAQTTQDRGTMSGSTPDVAKKYARIIGPGQQAQPLTAKGKFALSLRNRLTLSATAGSLFSAGISDWTDDVPHYGVDLPAFGERFGAAELKATTESFFSYGLYASLFHDDPHFYVMGREHKIVKRAIYAASRVVITRKDDGDTAINWPKLAGPPRLHQ